MPNKRYNWWATARRLYLSESGTDVDVDAKLLEILIATFRDLRDGRTEEGWNVERPAAVMSTAEAVTVAAAITRQGAFFPSQKDPISLLPGYLLGVVLKDNPEDRDRLLAYWDGPIRRRSEDDTLWKRMYELRDVLEEAELERLANARRITQRRPGSVGRLLSRRC